MSVLNTNKLTWFQNEGEPLRNGYVYVGQAGLDPQVSGNQKTVTFTDAIGNSFTATQPLRTNDDGHIQWNGKAITATVTGSYSLLLLNSNQVQINGGWTPTVESSTATVTANDSRHYALLLADLKKLDLSAGDTAANIGKVSVEDGLGSEWLVISSTGGAADDIDLIDFDNGTQGQRIKNFILESQTTADKLAFRTNIDVYSKAEAFAQNTETSIWTGSSTAVDISSELTANGNGFYTVKNSLNEFCTIYFRLNEQSTQVYEVNDFLADLTVTRVELSNSNIVTWEAYRQSISGPSSTFNITEIFKLG